jgi:hypothetical protein
MIAWQSMRLLFLDCTSFYHYWLLEVKMNRTSFDDYAFIYLFLMIQNVMHNDFVIYQFARNIIRSGLCNIISHAELEYKTNNDLFYSLNLLINTLWTHRCSAFTKDLPVIKIRVAHLVSVFYSPIMCINKMVHCTLFI